MSRSGRDPRARASPSERHPVTQLGDASPGPAHSLHPRPGAGLRGGERPLGPRGGSRGRRAPWSMHRFGEQAVARGDARSAVAPARRLSAGRRRGGRRCPPSARVKSPSVKCLGHNRLPPRAQGAAYVGDVPGCHGWFGAAAPPRPWCRKPQLAEGGPRTRRPALRPVGLLAEGPPRSDATLPRRPPPQDWRHLARTFSLLRASVRAAGPPRPRNRRFPHPPVVVASRRAGRAAALPARTGARRLGAGGAGTARRRGSSAATGLTASGPPPGRRGLRPGAGGGACGLPA